MTKEEMLQRMSARELAEWQAYDKLEPIGEPRADLRIALLMQLLANQHRDPDKKPSPFRADEFMWPGPDALVKAPTEEDRQRSLTEKIKAALGGKKRGEEA